MSKELVLKAFREFAAGNVEVLRTVLHEDFVEHSPGNPSGRDAFTDFMAASPVARATFDLKRVVAGDDYVVMHYHLREPGDDRGVAVVDIWRLEDGLIVEHWDIMQPVPDPSEVPNGMF
jgi:predicted SnoaL-like aldol condensation-catalyzing enzyme